MNSLNTVSLPFKEMCKGPIHVITDKMAGWFTLMFTLSSLTCASLECTDVKGVAYSWSVRVGITHLAVSEVRQYFCSVSQIICRLYNCAGQSPGWNIRNRLRYSARFVLKTKSNAAEKSSLLFSVSSIKSTEYTSVICLIVLIESLSQFSCTASLCLSSSLTTVKRPFNRANFPTSYTWIKMRIITIYVISSIYFFHRL